MPQLDDADQRRLAEKGMTMWKASDAFRDYVSKIEHPWSPFEVVVEVENGCTGNFATAWKKIKTGLMAATSPYSLGDFDPPERKSYVGDFRRTSFTFDEGDKVGFGPRTQTRTYSATA